MRTTRRIPSILTATIKGEAMPEMLEVWLVDPDDVTVSHQPPLPGLPAAIIVEPNLRAVVAKVEMPESRRIAFNPGQLRVTVNVWNQWGKEIVPMFQRHLQGDWVTTDRADRRVNDEDARNAQGIYDFVSGNEPYIVTHVGHDCTMCMSEEL